MACGLTVPTTTPTWSRESRWASPPTPTPSRSERASDRTGVDESKTCREIDNGQCCLEVRELSQHSGQTSGESHGCLRSIPNAPDRSRTGARPRHRSRVATNGGTTHQGRPLGRGERLSDEQAYWQQRHQRQEREDRDCR